MTKPTPRFLQTPAEIRKAVSQLQGGKRLDLAVAFVGADWHELLAVHRGKLRLICWLSSTNTNPYAVEDLMNRPDTVVRQRGSMHGKVYIAPGGGAIIGSANLSKAALSDSEISGQDEAAVLVTETAFVLQVENWFNSMWKDTQRTKDIKKDDLDAAKRAYDKAPRSGRGHSNGRITVPALPSKIPPELLKYARKVRHLNLGNDIGECCTFTQSLNPAHLTRSDRQELVEHVVSWTGHPGSYKTFLSQPLSGVRIGLSLLFDDAIDLELRVNQINEKAYLRGLAMPSMSLLLYWRKPERFVPYNFRTIAFLRDFKLLKAGMSGSSSRCYVKWLRWTTGLAQRLQLPSPGHIDRIVDLHYGIHYANA